MNSLYQQRPNRSSNTSPEWLDQKNERTNLNMKPLFTRNELMYIKVTLFAFREIQKRVGKDKQDREFAKIVNKITDEVNRIDGKRQEV